jgi:Xaa-Pro dipeptidase
VRPFSNLPARALAIIGEKKLTEANFGLVGVEESMALGEWTEIEKALGEARWHNRTAQMSALRQIKDRWEIDALKRSAAVLADAFDCVPRVIRAGTTTRQLTAAVDRVLRRGAAEDVRILIGGSFPGGESLRPGGEAVLRPGDSVMLYAAGEVQRYWAAVARTFVLGPASPGLRALAERAHAALAAMRKAAVPGATAAAVAAAADACLADRELRNSAAAHGLGHGIGLNPEEAPMITAANDKTIRAGMSLALQVISRGGDESIAFGEMIFVGATANETLIEAPALIERALSSRD